MRSIVLRRGSVAESSGWRRPCRHTLIGVELTDLVVTRPGVRSGKPCFVGTRITVDDVLEYVASGMTAEAVIADFPELTIDQVDAARDSTGRR